MAVFLILGGIALLILLAKAFTGGRRRTRPYEFGGTTDMTLFTADQSIHHHSGGHHHH